MNILFKQEDRELEKRLFRHARFKGGSAPQVDYAAMNRAQEQKRQRLQAERDEELRVSSIGDYINYMYDNPEHTSLRAATGQFYTATSPGRVPSSALEGYKSDKSIKLSNVKASTEKFFTQRTPLPSLKKGRIQLGKRAEKPIKETLLGSADVDKKSLLGA